MTMRMICFMRFRILIILLLLQFTIKAQQADSCFEWRVEYPFVEQFKDSTDVVLSISYRNREWHKIERSKIEILHKDTIYVIRQLLKTIYGLYDKIETLNHTIYDRDIRDIEYLERQNKILNELSNNTIKIKRKLKTLKTTTTKLKKDLNKWH